MSKDIAFTELPSLAHVDLANYGVEVSETEQQAWKSAWSEALEWREVGYPQEAADQLLHLAKAASQSKIKDSTGEECSPDHALCYYALCRAEASILSGQKSDQRIGAEYALCALQIDRSYSGVLADVDWERSLCLAVGGMLEQISRCANPEVTGEFLHSFLSSNDPYLQCAATLAYLRVLRVIEQENALPDVLRTTNIRVGVKEYLVAHWSEKLDDRARRMPWNELLPVVLQQYNALWGELFSSLKLFAASADLAAMADRRTKVLRAIARFNQSATQSQAILLEDAREILSRCLSDYLNERQTASLRTYDRIMKRLRSLANRTVEEPSLLGTGLLLPVVKCLRDQIQKDYEDRWQRGAPDIHLSLAKPYYPLTIQGNEIEAVLHITNTGNLEARGFKVELEVREDRRQQLEILTPLQSLDLLPVTTRPIPLTYRICVLEPCIDAYLYYRLSWQGLKGEERRQDEIRLVAQRDIDWNVPNPYSLLPVEDLDRLKGRDEILASLCRGVESSGSFYITGQKRVGKSSISKALGKKFAGSEWLVVEVLWGHVTGARLEIVFRKFAERISQAAHSRFDQHVQIEVPSLEEFEDSFAVAFSDFCQRFHLACPGTRVLLIIDDFDELTEDLYSGPLGDAFFTVLRATVADPSFCLVFVGGEKLGRIQRLQGGRLNTVMPRTVDYLEHPESFRELVVYPVRDILEFDETAISRIFATSAGNPFYATLVCRNVYDRAVTRRTAYIDEQDVEGAIDQLAREAKEGQFSHFWEDGPHIGTEQQQAISNAGALVFMAFADAAETVEGSVEKNTISSSGLLQKQDPRLVEQVLTQLEARGILIRDGTKLRAKVPLLVSWLKGTGGKILRDAPFVHELREELDAQMYQVAEEQLCELAEGLVYRDERVNEVRIRAWLNQFSEPRDCYSAFLLLKRLKESGHITRENMQHWAADCYSRVKALAGSESPSVSILLDQRSRPLNVFVSTPDEAGDSGANIVRLFRDVTRVTKPRHGSLSSVVQGIKDFLGSPSANNGAVFLLVNDLIASGQSANREISGARKLLDEQIPDWHSKRLVLFYVALAGMASILESIREAEQDVQVLVGHEFDYEVIAFDPRARIFDDDIMRTDAERLARRIGARLGPPAYALGWNSVGLLVLLPDNCPNTTLPIFWQCSSEAEHPWVPLFPRL